MAPYLTIIKRETDPPEVIEHASYEEARAYFERASEQWSESYLVQTLAGPGMPLVPRSAP